MRIGKWLQGIAGLVLALQLGAAHAAGNDGGLLPQIVAAQGEACIADTDFMRRNHMELLKHQRDETMYRGIRQQAESLQNCLACHARDADGQPVSADAPGQFCSSCHEYAAVTIDCFSCHSSRPTPGLVPDDGHAMTGSWSLGLASAPR